MEIAVFLNKWLHLFSMVAVLGSIFFMLVIALPAFRGGGLDDTEPGRELRKRFGMITGMLWLVVLATGFLNYYFVTHGAQPLKGTYHMLAGMKIAFALLMFVLTSVLGHPIPALSKLQSARSLWLTILLLLGVVVLGISAQLNISRVNRSAYAPPAAAAPAQP